MDEVDELICAHGERAVFEAVRPLLSDERLARIDEVLAARLGSVTVVLENLYDPHNGAAVMRSSEAFGLQDVHVVEGPSGPFRPAHEITIGCDKWMDVHVHDSVAGARRELGAAGFTSVATVPGAELSVDQIDVSGPVALWLGNEREGLSEAAVAACDVRASIPMHGFSQSFNLSVSAALVLREVVGRRRRLLGARGDLDTRRRERLRTRWVALGIRGLSEIVGRYVAK